jgi:hypothetical protein
LDGQGASDRLRNPHPLRKMQYGADCPHRQPEAAKLASHGDGDSTRDRPLTA